MIKKNSKKILYKKQTHNRCTFSVSHIFVWLLSSPLPRSHFLLWPTERARTPLVGCCSCFRPEWSRNTHVETKTKKAKSNLVFENPNQTRERIEQKKKSCAKFSKTRHGAQRFHSRFPNVKKTFKYRCAISLLRAHPTPFRRNRPYLPPRRPSLYHACAIVRQK